MTHPHREFNTIAFRSVTLITFRAFGTWLHGDLRGSVDRFHNRYGSPLIPPNQRWRHYNERALKRPPVKSTARRPAAIETAIRETCKTRKWRLWAINARTNHVHSVVTANRNADIVLNAFKGQCNTQNEGVRLLAKRRNTLG